MIGPVNVFCMDSKWSVLAFNVLPLNYHGTSRFAMIMHKYIQIR